MLRFQVPEKDWSLIKFLSTNQEAIDEVAKHKTDVLILDGDHTFAGVQSDFLNYKGLVQQGGYIIFDDYNTPEWPEVKIFVDEYVMNYSDLEFIGASWRTAVFRVREPNKQ